MPDNTYTIFRADNCLFPANQDLHDSRILASALLNTPFFMSIIIDANGIIQDLSDSMAAELKAEKKELTGKSIWETISGNSINIKKDCISDVLKFKTPSHYEENCDGRWFDFVIYPIIYAGNYIARIAILCRDISIRKKAFYDLRLANEKLIREGQALNEKNIALKQILEHMEEEKNKIRINIKNNIDKTISPIIRKLRDKISEEQLPYLELLEKHLNEISSSFIGSLESSFATLTPRELEICKMIKDGMCSKEIAALHDISCQTVLMHRKRIRNKLGITNQRINLVSFLQSL